PVGYTCLPGTTNVCVPSGGLGVLESCSFNDCASGLACRTVDTIPGCSDGWFGGCCLPICDLQQPQCPAELANCTAVGDPPFGLCMP
ncbi:MAG: hypothetical protein KC457_37550, partial [Myxococcales bacterium]|nr:hypothetical protein [Myxococcales bacterium]